MEIFIIVLHVLVALFMILVVLIQGGNQGGVGAAFGGGNTQGVFGATGATSFLGKLTYTAAAIFMVTSISLLYLHGGQKAGLSDKLQQELQDEQEQQGESKQTPEAKPAQEPSTGTDAASAPTE